MNPQSFISEIQKNGFLKAETTDLRSLFCTFTGVEHQTQELAGGAPRRQPILGFWFYPNMNDYSYTKT
jgi:hypothetical protein